MKGSPAQVLRPVLQGGNLLVFPSCRTSFLPKQPGNRNQERPVSPIALPFTASVPPEPLCGMVGTSSLDYKPRWNTGRAWAGEMVWQLPEWDRHPGALRDNGRKYVTHHPVIGRVGTLPDLSPRAPRVIALPPIAEAVVLLWRGISSCPSPSCGPQPAGGELTLAPLSFQRPVF